MLALGDVASIGLAAVRHVIKQNPQANVYCLTHGEGAELLRLAESKVNVLTLEGNIWPDDVLLAIESFLGMAEKIVGFKFDSIINLDTAFMPCFLARFLKDAGEPVSGNVIGISVQTLFSQLEQQTLKAEYVNEPQSYLQSSFPQMHNLHTLWWTREELPENGYPEYYLKHCCGFAEIEMDFHIGSNKPSLRNDDENPRLYISLNDPTKPYTELDELTLLLQNKGFIVNLDNETSPLKSRLAAIRTSDLVVTLPNAVFSFANCFQRQTLLIPGEVDPRMLMPDYATDQYATIPEPSEFADNIASIFDTEGQS